MITTVIIVIMTIIIKKIEITRAMAKTKLYRCVSTTNTKTKQR